MHDELPRLPGTASKQSSEDGDVQPSFLRGIRHLHVGRHVGSDAAEEARIGLALVQHGVALAAGTASSSLLTAIVLGKILGIHVHDRQQAAAEHALPLALLDVLSMVSTRQGLGLPLLLEKGEVAGVGDLEAC